MTQARDKYKRTVCACDDCREPCRHMPGMLTPSDIGRLLEWMDKDTPGFSLAAGLFLAASKGALIGDLKTGQTYRIPTIVPARHPKTGVCSFLMDDGLCAIHDVAPYGCSHFDTHMSREEGDRRVYAGLEEITQSKSYAELWRLLFDRGSIAPSPDEGRKKVQAALDRNRQRAAAVNN